MHFRRSFSQAVRQSLLGLMLLCLLGTLAFGQNQYVGLLPGPGNPSTNLLLYLAGQLTPAAALGNISGGTFLMLPAPDGSKYYLVANGGTAVQLVDSNFQNLRTIAGNIDRAPTNAAFTSDGRRLVVTAGRVYFIDIQNDTVLNPAGTIVDGDPIDVVTNYESTRAFVLSRAPVAQGGTVITAIDTTNYQIVGTPLRLTSNPGSPPTGIVYAPTGNLYVSSDFRIYEIDPRTLRLTTNGEISVLAYPGKPFITSDGRYLIAANLRPVQGNTSLVQVDLQNKSVGSFPAFETEIFDRFVANGRDGQGNQRLYGISQSGRLYDIRVGNLNIDRAAINILFGTGPQAPAFSGLAFSNENPPRYFFSTNNIQGVFRLIQADLRDQNITAQVPIPTVQAQLAFVAPNPTSGGTVLQGFNNNQVVNAGQQSGLPLVVRLLDPLGRPIYRGQVAFSANNPALQFQNQTVITGVDGYAQTFITAPASAQVTGPITITANAGQNITFDFTISVPGGGSGGVNQGGIFIVAGNGQVVRENFAIPQTSTIDGSLGPGFVVQVRDAQGNPTPNAQVSWSIVSGAGSIGGSTAVTTQTDQNGISQIGFLATQVPTGLSFQQTQVQAAGPSGNVTFWVTTVAATLPGGGLSPDPVVQILQPTLESGRTIRGTAGSLVPNAIVAVVAAAAGEASGRAISNVGIRAFTDENDKPVDQRTLPSASCEGDPLTDASGRVVCNLRLGAKTGQIPLRVRVGEFNRPAEPTLIVDVGPPSRIVILSGNNQTGRPGTRLPAPLRVRITDAGGNPLEGQTISWSVITGNATLNPTTSVTDSIGGAFTNVTLGNAPGLVRVRALFSATVSVTFDLNVEVVAAGLTIVGGNNQTVIAGQTFPEALAVVVRDAQGNPVPNVSISFTPSGGITLSNQTVTTDSTGRASVVATAGTVPGPVSVTAAIVGASGLLQVFSLSIRPPGPVVNPTGFTNAASGEPGLTPCGLAVITGQQLAPGVSGVQSGGNAFGGGPYRFTVGPVDGVEIGGIATPILYVSNQGNVEQIGIQTPCDLPPGTTSAVLRVRGGATTVQGIRVVAFQPGIFEELASDGRRYAVAIRPDGTQVGPNNRARRGEVIRLAVTGLGQASPRINTNALGVANQNVTANVFVGVNDAGARAGQVQYVAGQIGIYSVEIEIPLDTPTGAFQTIAVAVSPASGDPIFAGSFIPIQ
jgi:uncharacterized protein (TIGR03437 family)